MFKSKSIIISLTLLAVVSFSATALAADIQVDPGTAFCFSSDDFSVADTDEGIFITAVPSTNIASICYGTRTLKAGDALPTDALDNLSIETNCVTEQTVCMEYCTVSEGKITDNKSLKFSIFPKKNDPPIAKPGSFETYRNMENSGSLSATDPEGSTLIYKIVEEPKRGSVELHTDGTFTYTPHKNKVGNDSFSFTATDDAGNTSEPAKVSVKIMKPADKATYEDMQNDPDQFLATWLREKGIFSGGTIAGHCCFSPEKEVTRGEFLVMVMKLVGAENVETTMTSGFADEADTPKWMQSYITTALCNGMIAGTNTESGLVFQPDDPIEKAEAAVMVQNILSLPAAVFSNQSQEFVPAWAADSIGALAQAGVTLELSSADDLLTRRDAARVMYGMEQLMKETAVPTFYWLQ